MRSWANSKNVQGWPTRYERITRDLYKCARRDAGHADRTGVRVLVTGRVAEEVRSKKTHALLSNGIRCAAWAWDGRLSPRMDSCGVQLRHEQPRQVCLCRHAAVDPRHSLASEPRACVLGRRSAHSEPLGPCCALAAQDEDVRQQCQCRCIVETVLATAVARGRGPVALVRTLVVHCTGHARGYGVSVVVYPSYVSPHPCSYPPHMRF